VIDEDSTPEVTLVLRSAAPLEGRVVTRSGAGVAGASVVALPTDLPQLPTMPVQNDSAGRFSATLPPGTGSVVLNVEVHGVARKSLGRAIAPDQVLTVTLDTATGRLILDVGDTDARSMMSAFAYHDGGFAPVSILANWSARNGGIVDSGAGVIEVPLMAPGYYRLCRLLGPHEYSSFMSGLLPSERCAAGELMSGGELRLAVPAGGAAEGGDDSR
jgi:hypothetical protein